MRIARAPGRIPSRLIFALTPVFLEDIISWRNISSLTTDKIKSDRSQRIIFGIIPAKSLFRNILPATHYSSKILTAVSP
jgi:hypothetical protein